MDTNYDKASTCEKGENVLEKFIFQSHLFIDCRCLYGWTICCFHWYREVECGTWIYKIQKIEHDNNYILAGVVSYNQYANDKNNGHYLAFVYDTQ